MTGDAETLGDSLKITIVKKLNTDGLAMMCGMCGVPAVCCITLISVVMGEKNSWTVDQVDHCQVPDRGHPFYGWWWVRQCLVYLIQ